MKATYNFEQMLPTTDLAPTSFAEAIKKLDGSETITLMVRETNAFYAGFICGLYEDESMPLGRRQINVVFLPREMVPDVDVWAVTDGTSVIWSSGA